MVQIIRYEKCSLVLLYLYITRGKPLLCIAQLWTEKYDERGAMKCPCGKNLIKAPVEKIWYNERRVEDGLAKCAGCASPFKMGEDIWGCPTEKDDLHPKDELYGEKASFGI